MTTRSRGAIVRLAIMATLLGPAALHAQAQGANALSLDEVLQLQRSRVAAAQILQSAREYCIAFEVLDAAERSLRNAGADDALIDALRGVCRVLPPRAAPAPAGAPTAAAATTAPSLGVAIIEDDFHASRRLPISPVGTQPCRSSYDDAGFTVTSRHVALGCTVGYPSEALLGDVRIEVEVALLGARESMAAIGFGKQSASWDRLSFNVFADGRFELCRFTGPQCTRVIAPTSTGSAMRRTPRAANRLAIEVRAGQVLLYVNDLLVGRTNNAGDAEGLLVLGVGPLSEASFRRLRVTRIGN